jgi:hypothetical protein
MNKVYNYKGDKILHNVILKFTYLELLDYFCIINF